MKRLMAIAALCVALWSVAPRAAASPVNVWAWEYTMYAFCELCSGCACSGDPNPFDP